MKSKQFIHNLQTKVFCRLAPSKIQGVGVFAIRPIPAGTFPLKSTRTDTFVEMLIKDFEASELIPVLKQLVKDFCPKRKEDGVFDIPTYSLNEIGIAWYINHSKTPNMNEIGGDFYANRHIAVGEELTVDYGTYGELNL